MKVDRPVLLMGALALLSLMGCAAEGDKDTPQSEDDVRSESDADTDVPSDGDDDESPSGDDTDTPSGDDTGGDDPGPVEADAAEIVETSFPTSMACRGSGTGVVVVRNTGSETWTREAGYKLGTVDDSDDFYQLDTRIWLPEEASIAPGETWTFEITLIAPGTEAEYTTDWQMVHEGVRWFGETTEADINVTCGSVEGRTGAVRLSDHSLVDDTGEFNALGATLMWAAWGMRNDPDRLAENLSYLSDNGFHYIRALGVVGDPDDTDYWDGREIDWRWADYADVIAQTTDLAYDTYGLRVQWTLIGDGQLNIPDESDRYDLVDTFLEMSEGREHKIIAFEIANEAWQNGFEGDEGVEQLRALTEYMNDRTDILVAASAPAGHECEDALEIYAGGIADFATIHFDRETGLADGHWRPVRQPWEHDYCAGVPVGSNHEPIGPGSSVDTETDPVKLVAGAIATYVSNLPMYVFHSGAGVRGDQDLWDMAGSDAFVHLDTIVPGDLASWSRRNAHWPDSPFLVYAEDEDGDLYADQMWPDLDEPAGGVVRAYGGVDGDEFFVFPIGILDHVLMEARRDMTFDVIDPMTGSTLETVTLDAGEQHTLSGHAALVLRGSFR